MTEQPTHHVEFADCCREVRVFRTEQERDYWKDHHTCEGRRC